MATLLIVIASMAFPPLGIAVFLVWVLACLMSQDEPKAPMKRAKSLPADEADIRGFCSLHEKLASSDSVENFLKKI